MSKSIKIHLTRQIKNLKQAFFQEDNLPFSSLLPSPLLKRIATTGNSRDTVFTPLVTLKAFIFQVLCDDSSCKNAVARVLTERLQNGLPANSVNTGPYCKARQRLPLKPLTDTARVVGSQLSEQTASAWQWLGFNVVMADGTTVLMPDTEDNQKVFPQQGNQKPGLGFPIARLVALISLSVGTVLDYAVGPYQGKGTGETSLFSTLISSLSQGQLLLADRYYCTYAIVILLRQRGVPVVFRNNANKKADFRCGKKLGSKDHLIEWRKPPRAPVWLSEQAYAELPEVITIREFAVSGIVYVSTLVDANTYPKTELAALYQRRWSIELDIRSIKTHMGMDMLRCQSADMVKKEIAIHMLAYNLIRTNMAQAAAVHNKFPRFISFKAAVQLVNQASLQFAHLSGTLMKDVLDKMLAMIAATAIGQRERKKQPPAIKRRPKPYPLLTRPRHEMVTICNKT